jgi:hypothetical protein
VTAFVAAADDLNTFFACCRAVDDLNIIYAHAYMQASNASFSLISSCTYARTQSTFDHLLKIELG